jgi:hypothetical protein
MTWYYKGEAYEPDYEEDLKDLAGFVYVIWDRSTGKGYVGKKGFHSKKTLPPLKGKTRKRRRIVESDWKTYYGSSNTVKALLEKHGEDNFDREILHLCQTKGNMSYLELYEQMKRNVLLSDSYYNGIIQCRINSSHLKGLNHENL